MNWYNENDPKMAAWLRQLIEDGLIGPGVVDERSITEIKADELNGYRQYHFFAGIGGWPYALRLAGWPDDEEVWTGSCPCQPFSQAGKRKVDSDERHLWPAFRAAIAERRPSVVFGEQVASKDGRIWLAGVRADLEALGYAVGAADLCAAGVSAPHIRQRLYWVADAKHHGRDAKHHGRDSTQRIATVARSDGENERLFKRSRGDVKRPRRRPTRQRKVPVAVRSLHGSAYGGVGDTAGAGRERDRPEALPWGDKQQPAESMFWSKYDLIACADGLARRIEPGTFPLAHGIPARMGRLRGYGNAIVPELAAEFIGAYVEGKAGLMV